jgi:hypothetical protein
LTIFGRRRDYSGRQELPDIGAMFHDLGLSEEFRRRGRRFEVDSADEACRFPGYGVAGESIRRVWTGDHIRHVKADVLERFVPGFQRANFVDVILNSDWLE